MRRRRRRASTLYFILFGQNVVGHMMTAMRACAIQFQSIWKMRDCCIERRSGGMSNARASGLVQRGLSGCAVVGVIMFSVRRSRVFNEMIWWEQINSVECAPTERIWFDVVMPIIICRPQQLERTIEPA